MSSDRWITNLESTAALETAVRNAEVALKVAKDTGEGVRQATAMLSVAKYKLADNKKTMHEISRENGDRIAIGEPRATPYKTAEAIAAEGIVGIYRQGAGDGPSGVGA